MKRHSLRTAALLVVVVSIAPDLWAPPKPGAKPRSKPSVESDLAGETRSRFNPSTGRYESAKPFAGILREEPFKLERYAEKSKESDRRAERTAVLKMLAKEPLSLEEHLTLMRLQWDSRLTWDEHRMIREHLDATRPRPSFEETRAREIHETWVPAHEIPVPESALAAPARLRDSLAFHIDSIRQARVDMYAFQRGVERLRRKGWNAEQELAKAAQAEKAASKGRPRRRMALGPEGFETPAPPLPPDIIKLLPKEATRSWHKYAHRILTGQDPATSLAYVDFLYAGALSGAGRFAELAKWKVPRETAPAGSETSALRELTRAIVVDAHVHTAKSVFPHLTTVLAMKAPPHRFASALPNTMELALRRAGREILALQRMPDWQRATKLTGEIEGFASTPKAVDLYLRQGQSLHLVRVDRKSGQPTVLRGDQAGAAFREHCRAQVKKYSRPGFRLANVLRAGEEYRIQTADRDVRISKAELAILEGGKPLPPEHALSAALAHESSFVIYSNPFMAREGRPRADADRLAFALQRSYPELRVFKDDLSDRTESRARAVQEFVIEKPSDVLVLTAAKSFNVDDANIINDVADEFKKSGIRVEELTEASVAEPAARSRFVIVISGHVDANLAAFVRRAGEAGYFRNNIVAFNTCASELTSQLVHEMNTRYGAVATHRHEGKIPASKVQDVLMKLNDRIESQPTLEDWKKFVLEVGLTGVWNICLLEGGEERIA